MVGIFIEVAETGSRFDLLFRDQLIYIQYFVGLQAGFIATTFHELLTSRWSLFSDYTLLSIRKLPVLCRYNKK